MYRSASPYGRRAAFLIVGLSRLAGACATIGFALIFTMAIFSGGPNGPADADQSRVSKISGAPAAAQRTSLLRQNRRKSDA